MLGHPQEFRDKSRLETIKLPRDEIPTIPRFSFRIRNPSKEKQGPFQSQDVLDAPKIPLIPKIWDWKKKKNGGRSSEQFTRREQIRAQLHPEEKSRRELPLGLKGGINEAPN